MSMGKNIAEFRKRKGFTQEELGRTLSVTNQAVSKWESETSMPDVMMLPRIADALDVTLDDLYGIKRTEKSAYVTADDFPREANQRLIEYFQKHSRIQYHTENLEDLLSLVCLSDTNGGVYISKNFSVVDCCFKKIEDADIFTRIDLASAFDKLSKSHVRKVLAYMYKESFSRGETMNSSFSIRDLSDQCELFEDEVINAVEELYSLQLLEISEDGLLEIIDEEGHLEIIDIDEIDEIDETPITFLKFRAFLVLTIFKTTELLLNETFSFEVVRDTSLIRDYAFLEEDR